MIHDGRVHAVIGGVTGLPGGGVTGLGGGLAEDLIEKDVSVRVGLGGDESGGKSGGANKGGVRDQDGRGVSEAVGEAGDAAILCPTNLSASGGGGDGEGKWRVIKAAVGAEFGVADEPGVAVGIAATGSGRVKVTAAGTEECF